MWRVCAHVCMHVGVCINECVIVNLRVLLKESQWYNIVITGSMRSPTTLRVVIRRSWLSATID